MTIDFILDISCLWSYIVWHQLRISLRECAIQAKITPFFISSGSFFAGFDISPADKARMLEERARPLLEQNDLFIDFDRLPALSGDLSFPCQLIRTAFAEKKYTVLDDVFAAFFAFGQDITSFETLEQIAIRNGLERKPVSCFRSLPTGMPEGLRAVPCLIFDKSIVLFGAQSVPCLKNILHLTRRIRKENAF